MANTLNLIKDTKATTTSTTTSSILGETTKDKPSLFDSLLANNTSGNKGVHFDKTRNKWKAEIKKDGININLGRFDSIEDAKKHV